MCHILTASWRKALAPWCFCVPIWKVPLNSQLECVRDFSRNCNRNLPDPDWQILAPEPRNSLELASCEQEDGFLLISLFTQSWRCGPAEEQADENKDGGLPAHVCLYRQGRAQTLSQGAVIPLWDKWAVEVSWFWNPADLQKGYFTDQPQVICHKWKIVCVAQFRTWLWGPLCWFQRHGSISWRKKKILPCGAPPPPPTPILQGAFRGPSACSQSLYLVTFSQYLYWRGESSSHGLSWYGSFSILFLFSLPSCPHHYCVATTCQVLGPESEWNVFLRLKRGT